MAGPQSYVFFLLALLFLPPLVIFAILLIIFKEKLKALVFWKKLLLGAGFYVLSFISWIFLAVGLMLCGV